MRILYLNTCESAFVAALENSDVAAHQPAVNPPTPWQIVAWQVSDNPRRQVEDLSTLVQKTLEKTGWEKPDGVLVSRGPAPFTGLRVGLVTARTLAEVWQVPLWGIEELATIATWGDQELTAQPTPREGQGETAAGGASQGQYILAVMDAKRKELYWRLFARRGARLQALVEAQVSTPADLVQHLSQLVEGFSPAVAAAEGEQGKQGEGAEQGEQSADNADLGHWDGRVAVYGTGPGLYPRYFAGIKQLSPLSHPAAFAAAAAGHWQDQMRAADEKSADLGTEPQYLRRPDVHPGGKKANQTPG